MFGPVTQLVVSMLGVVFVVFSLEVAHRLLWRASDAE